MFRSIVEFATRGDMKNVITKLDDTEINGRRIRIVEQMKPRRRPPRYENILSNKCLPFVAEVQICYCCRRYFIKFYVHNFSDVCYICCTGNSQLSDITQNYSSIAALYILCVTVRMSF